jgi:hypothetical protein
MFSYDLVVNIRFSDDLVVNIWFSTDLVENRVLFTSFTPQKASTFVLFARAGWSIRGDCFVANGDPDCNLQFRKVKPLDASDFIGIYWSCPRERSKSEALVKQRNNRS